MSINDVDAWVQSVSGVVERFYPTAPAKATGLPLGAVFRQLVGLAHVGWLDLVYEVRCNACNITIAIEHVTDPTMLYEKEYSCHLCGDEFEVTAENVYPLFVVRDEWSSGLKKVPAANGQKAYPIGGEPAPIEAIGLGWIDYVLNPDEVRDLKELAATVPVVRRALAELDQGAMPRNFREKTDWLKRFKELGEALNEWVKLGKNVAVPIAMARAPEAIAAMEKLLNLITQ